MTEEQIGTEIRQKFDRWIAARDAKVVETPINKIDWNALIQDALWRNPPFVDKKAEEKGVRDALILQTTIHQCSQEPRNHPIAFICKDRLLRETAIEELKNDERFTAYELITGFRSYLDLTKEKLEKQFIQAILRRANIKF